MRSCLILFMVSSLTYARSWQEILQEHAVLLQSVDSVLIMRQFNAFQQSQAPVIADKRITEIPIIECGEECIDIRTLKHTRITMLPDPEYPFAASHCNAGFASSSKMRKGLAHCLVNMILHLDRLAPHFGYTPGALAIKIFEGLRSYKTQKLLFYKKRDEIKFKQPGLSDEALDNETAKWISPIINNIPVHTTGAAVDIVLWDNVKNQPVDMGPFGVILGQNDSAPTFSENVTDVQKIHRLYWLLAAELAGLTNYVYEFWHFSYHDRYAAYWCEQDRVQRYSTYGMVIETFFM